MFVSHRRLKDRKRLPAALGDVAIDCGGFTELLMHGKWIETPKNYVRCLRRYVDEIGNIQWAPAQDWMCEPFMTKKTGLSVSEHQRRTIDSYLELRGMAPELPIIPVLQGYTLDDYQRCRDGYDAVGVDLASLPLVGLGSVCRRQHTREIQEIAHTFSHEGIRLHGFGVKLKGCGLLRDLLTSSDSMAWSFAARRSAPLKGCSHKNCANCIVYAETWYWRMVGLINEPTQRGLFFG